MARDILGGFGPNSSQPQVASASNGGDPRTKDVRNYATPQGPKGIMDPQSPGLHGTNHGVVNGPDRCGQHSGSPGLGGTNHGCCGSQGKH